MPFRDQIGTMFNSEVRGSQKEVSLKVPSNFIRFSVSRKKEGKDLLQESRLFPTHLSSFLNAIWLSLNHDDGCHWEKGIGELREGK